MSAPSDTGERPLISVITATWNLLSEGRQDTFRRVIECMARQKCDQAEHVIQDGASTDGTVEFIEGLVANTPNTRLISAPDQGLYDAMNRGVEAARGDYVLFLNSDDSLAADDVLNRAVERLTKTQPDYLFGSTLHRTADGAEKMEKRMSVKAILQRMPFCHNSVFLRRDVFLELGGHNTQFRIAADYDLMLRLVGGAYRGERIDEPISLFWDRGETNDQLATGRDYARVWQQFFADYHAAQSLDLNDFAEFYRRGHMPVRLLFEVLKRQENPLPIRQAAKHSLAKTLRRSVQFWRQF